MPVEKQLPTNHFNNIIRLVKTSSLDRIKEIETATTFAMERLGIARDLTQAQQKILEGSNQVDIGSFIVWLSKVQPGDGEAVKQIVAIDATASKRISG